MKGLSLKDRFYSKFAIKNQTGCWEWVANKFPKGYGCFKLNGKSTCAHRVSYEIHIGEIQDNMVICHKCDNPCCVNPEHLFMGTQKMNLEDRDNKGRSIVCERNGRSRLTITNVVDIREMLSKKIDQRIIAYKYNVAQTTISAINLNKTWRNI